MPDYDCGKCLVDIIGFGTELESGNAFGTVKSGFLILKGALAIGRYGILNDPSFDGFLGGKSSTSVELQISHNTFVEVRANCMSVDWDVPEPKSLRSNTPGIETHEELPDLYTLLTYRNPNRGLVLIQTEKPGVFKRLGVFWEHPHPNGLSAACPYFNSQAEKTGLVYEDDGQGGLKYTITLI